VGGTGGTAQAGPLAKPPLIQFWMMAISLLVATGPPRGMAPLCIAASAAEALFLTSE
jgi:hypothetical protein